MLLIVIAIFCLVHIFRDYLQIKGVKNWFTTFGHFWDAPKLEAPIAAILGIIGILCLYFALK